MKLAQFKTKTSDETRLGKFDGEVIIDISEVAPNMLEFIRKGSAALHAAKSVTPKAAYAPDAVEYLPAINAGKVLAIGRNYYDHAVEGGSEPPTSPLIFTKFINSLTAHNAKVTLHAISEKIDYEAELAVVIGRRAQKVNQEEALDYV